MVAAILVEFASVGRLDELKKYLQLTLILMSESLKNDAHFNTE